MSLALGDRAPDFALEDTNGGQIALAAGDEGSAATVVVFTCNHCPYAIAWHERIAAVARDYADRGVRVLAVNPNDAERYPRDSLPAMQERVAADGGWPMPYLHDESQTVAHSYGAKTTPDVFVFDRDLKLRYRGAPDDDYEDESRNGGWLREALDAVLEGREPAPAETDPVGCSIKWRG